MARFACLPLALGTAFVLASCGGEGARTKAPPSVATDTTHVRFVVFDMHWAMAQVEGNPSAAPPSSLASAGSPAVQPTFRHILLKPHGSDEEAKARATAAIARIAAGEPFAKVAREMSNEEASAAEGGAIPGADVSAFVEPIQKAFAELQPGESSKDPVQTVFGYHVLRKDTLAESAAAAANRESAQRLAKELAEDTLSRWKADPTANAQASVDAAIRARLSVTAAKDYRRPQAKFMDRTESFVGLSGECGVLQGGGSRGAIVQLGSGMASTLLAPAAGAARDRAICSPPPAASEQPNVEALAEALRSAQKDAPPEDRSTYVKTPRRKGRLLEIFVADDRARPLDGLSPVIGSIEGGDASVHLRLGERRAVAAERLATWLDGVAHPPGTFFAVHAQPGIVQSVLVREPVIVDDRDVQGAVAEETPHGVTLGITWTEAGRQRVADVTHGIVGRRIVILSNNDVLMVARLAAPVVGAKMRVLMPPGVEGKKRAEALSKQLGRRLPR